MIELWLSLYLLPNSQADKFLINVYELFASFAFIMFLYFYMFLLNKMQIFIF